MDDTALRVMQLNAQGYCCSQIMMQLALDDMGEENRALIRAMAGLCEGSGCGDTCGVATGGACVLSLYAAKGSDDELQLDNYPIMLSQFMDWFKASAHEWGGIRCEDIVAYQGGRKPEVCGDIMLRARETILAILMENDIDPSLPRDQANGF
ncbi:C_GCAxxG_C_C family protein [Desulfobulbus rhabdoformis]|uniref:DVU_1555 family C-GCAxxG-C-C protein n=1 Tax=Desulfobulbus rhabdoformis TaxID=34032 RepID=UPI00196304C1|nr:DV_1555 family C-GCAxxG-C-C protein [Desulfobulbus rhabdoformis]MBM9614389.1 C_GCAxxG_C_C family protein [Desulfobulbus rhabdoformis]